MLRSEDTGLPRGGDHRAARLANPAFLSAVPAQLRAMLSRRTAVRGRRLSVDDRQPHGPAGLRGSGRSPRRLPSDDGLDQYDRGVAAKARDGVVVTATGDQQKRTLRLAGALDLVSIETLENALSQLRHEKPAAIVLDLRDLTFIDSSGLWTITSARAWCAREGIHLLLIPAPERVQRVFEVTGLSDILPFAVD
jgi:anti-sigma B factor antagonist